MTVNEMMGAIQCLDADAHLRFSDLTHKWYVCADITISDDRILTNPVEHRKLPELAIQAFFNRLTNVQLPESLKADGRYYYWKGFMWRESGLEQRGAK